MFGEQTIANFLQAGKEATAILKRETKRRRELSLDESLALLAVSHLLTEGDENSFYPAQIANFVDTEDRAMYTVLERFHELGLFVVYEESHEEAIAHHGRPRHIYTPTRLGARLLILFQREG